MTRTVSGLLALFFSATLFSQSHYRNSWCQKRLSSKVCTEEYAPSECTALSINGIPLQPPVSATGSNPCYAEYNLQLAACNKGYNPDRFESGDITCKPIHICPEFACPGPVAQDCIYEPAPLDAYGCATGCGTWGCPVVDPLPPVNPGGPMIPAK